MQSESMNWAVTCFMAFLMVQMVCACIWWRVRGMDDDTKHKMQIRELEASRQFRLDEKEYDERKAIDCAVMR